MKLHDVLVSILIDAEDEKDAIEKTRKILSGEITIDYNWMVHKAENTGETLAELRIRQKIKGA